MTDAIEKLNLVRDTLGRGAQAPDETVRSILAWFGAERRSSGIVSQIRSALDERDLTTVPNFENVWIDSPIKFVKCASVVNASWQDDPTFRIGRLDASNKPVVSVSPNDPLEKAVTLMLINDFSQLPVMTGPRDVKGTISWKSIGYRLAGKKSFDVVKDLMERAEVISHDAPLLEAVDVINKHDYVLVIALDKSVSGLVTASDFNQQFRALAEPFLLVGEIENGIRKMLHGRFPLPDLIACCNESSSSREVRGPSDLTFGEYIRLIGSPESWEKLDLRIDRPEFISSLDRVRLIRNEVMHFDPDGLDPDDLQFLSDFAQFLKRLREISR